MKTIAAEKELLLNPMKLQERQTKLNRLKKILFINDETITESALIKELENISRNNFTHLIIIGSLIKEMPKAVKSKFEEINKSYCSEYDYLKKLRQIKSMFRNNSKFISYQYFALRVLAKEVLEEFEELNSENESKITEQYFVEKKILNCLIYNLAEKYMNKRIFMDENDITLNMHFVLKWLKENINRPIEPLTNDECEIIAGLIYGLSNKDILQLNLSSFVKDTKDVEKILSSLPSKFKVHNLTQVMFKIFHLSPHIWCLSSHEKIVETIMGIL